MEHETITWLKEVGILSSSHVEQSVRKAELWYDLVGVGGWQYLLIIYFYFTIYSHCAAFTAPNASYDYLLAFCKFCSFWCIWDDIVIEKSTNEDAVKVLFNALERGEESRQSEPWLKAIRHICEVHKRYLNLILFHLLYLILGQVRSYKRILRAVRKCS
jgi:hypothetical protein